MRARLEDRIRARGAELGFQRVAFSVAGPAPRAEQFRRWLRQGYAGEMSYLERNPDSRADVTLRSPWARTVVSAALRYVPAPEHEAGGERQAGVSSLVSRYARGVDYHDLLKKRLGELAGFIRAEAGGRVETRSLVDTSAILERDHAATAGLGWTGKNAMVIDPVAGSYFFLGELLSDLDLEPGTEMEDLCGGCTRCIDACPTGAIVSSRVVDARRCISYLTIELKGSVPVTLREPIGDHLFGCDVCQEVCPWNRQASGESEPRFRTTPALEKTTLAEGVALDEAGFAARFTGSAIKRAKRAGFVRNALIVAANVGDGAALSAGCSVLDDPDPELRETAIWALSRGEAEHRRAARLAAEGEPDPDLRVRMQSSLDPPRV